MSVPPYNGLTFGELLWGKIMRCYESSHPDMATLRDIGSASLALGSVGTSGTGLKFAEALARLTGRDSVRLMNWGATTDGASHSRLMRKHQAWCPLCLAEDPIPYFRELWDLELATSCSRHRRRLVHACGHCGAAQRRYRCDGSMALCQRCDHPLTVATTVPASPHETMVADQLGIVIAEVTAGRLKTTGDLMKTALFGWAEQQGATSVKAKARLIGMPQSLVCYWRYTDRQPSLQRLWELSLRNGLPLLDVCRGSRVITAHSLPNHGIPRAWQFRLLTPEQKEGLRSGLATIASREHPPCVQHAAIELGVSAGTLKALAPRVCEDMSKRSRSQRKLIVAVRFQRFQNKVKRYVDDIIGEGKVPTFQDISSCFKSPGVLRAPQCREYVRAEIERAKLQLFGDTTAGK